MQREPRYRLYVDESGDHTFTLADDPNHRYLGLLGIWFDAGEPYRSFAQELSCLKSSIFDRHPDEPPVCLHRKDIVHRKGVFRRLSDPDLDERFCTGLVEVVERAHFHMACVVIDKAAHRTKTYRELFHPYHYCLAALLERYAGWLGMKREQGDVLAESRGRAEDQELLLAYESTLRQGTRFFSGERFRAALTSGKVKLKKKEHAIPGLELADLLAYPFKREMIAEREGEPVPQDFGARLMKAARPKMNCQFSTGRVPGYGKVWLD